MRRELKPVLVFAFHLHPSTSDLLCHKRRGRCKEFGLEIRSDTVAASTCRSYVRASAHLVPSPASFLVARRRVHPCSFTTQNIWNFLPLQYSVHSFKLQCSVGRKNPK